MPRKLLYATQNPGKLMELRSILEPDGLAVLSPADIALALDVPEDGRTLEANATHKVRAYMHALDADTVVLGDDTGLAIDALDGEPGIHVRRWDGTRMSDEAIIAYCLDRMRDVPPQDRGAQFRTVFAVGVPGDDVVLFDGTLRGVILEEAAPLRIKGFPFESLFYVPEWAMLLGDATLLPPAQRRPYATHRVKALRSALPHLRELLNGG